LKILVSSAPAILLSMDLLDNYIDRFISINKKKILGVAKSKNSKDRIYELEKLVAKINRLKYEV
jgi:hypothetical protein